MIRMEEHTTHKLAGDNRLGGAVDSFEGQDALQRDVDTLEHQAMINARKLSDNSK